MNLRKGVQAIQVTSEWTPIRPYTIPAGTEIRDLRNISTNHGGKAVRYMFHVTDDHTTWNTYIVFERPEVDLTDDDVARFRKRAERGDNLSALEVELLLQKYDEVAEERNKLAASTCLNPLA